MKKVLACIMLVLLMSFSIPALAAGRHALEICLDDIMCSGGIWTCNAADVEDLYYVQIDSSSFDAGDGTTVSCFTITGLHPTSSIGFCFLYHAAPDDKQPLCYIDYMFEVTDTLDVHIVHMELNRGDLYQDCCPDEDEDDEYEDDDTLDCEEE